MTDISVVMGTYNGARHLREQLTSIIDQTYRPAEVVICDDCSTDDTVRVAEEIATTSPIPVRVHRNATRLGFADNFLQAARLSTRRYIAFSDQDDRWYPDKLAKSRAALTTFDAVMVTHQVHLMSEGGQRLGLDIQMIDETKVVEPLTADPFGVYFGFTLLVDRAILELIPADRRGMDNYAPTKVLSHDRWAYFLASSFGRIATVAEPLADYRQHGSQAFGVKPVTLPRRFRNKVLEGPTKLAFLADLAGQRAEMLADCAGAAEPAVWKAAADHWRQIEAMCRIRHDLYVDHRLAGRVSLLGQNLRRGAYRAHATGGLGRKRFLEDVSLGLFGKFALRW